jgi:nucleoside-diphosphate-sugar epimerase
VGRVKVLVTGGGGFIGSHLVRAMLGDGHDVRVIDNFATGRRENLGDLDSSVDLIEGDIQSYERVHNAALGCETVLHQAAMPSVPRSGGSQERKLRELHGSCGSSISLLLTLATALRALRTTARRCGAAWSAADA